MFTPIPVGNFPDKMRTKTLHLVLLLLSGILSQIIEDKPVIEEHPDAVIFRSHICQPVTIDVLQSLMGGNFDESRMATSVGKAWQLLRRRRSVEPTIVDRKSVVPTKSSDLHNASTGNWFLRRLQHRSTSDQIPWECKMTFRTIQNEKGVFPQFLVDGQCVTRKCFYDMYHCDPVKYAMKLLHKDIHSCNPVPKVANATVYEERWRLITYHVTVACSCVTTKPNRAQQQRNLLRKGG